MSNTPSDEELIAELEAAGVAFMAFRGGISGTKDIWTTSGSQDARKIAAGIRAVLAKWGTLRAEKIVIPTNTMEQEFQKHYRRGYEAGQKAAQGGTP